MAPTAVGYTLRAEFDPLDGRVIYLPDGKEYDLKKALDRSGTLKTTDPATEAILDAEPCLKRTTDTKGATSVTLDTGAAPAPASTEGS